MNTPQIEDDDVPPPPELAAAGVPRIHKIHVRLGDSEFSAEGSESSVQSQYEAFLDALGRLWSPVPVKLEPSTGTDRRQDDLDPDQNTLTRVFTDDKQKGISLRILPRGDTAAADALLLILYGYHAIRQEDPLSAIQLRRSSKQSGIDIERADRIFEAAGYYGILVSKSGQRAGSKYTLMNPGLAKARQLLGAILG